MGVTVDLSAWVGKVHCGDCLEVLRGLPDCSVDSVITDPPYELGFMGKSWDAQGISFRTDVWAECLRVAKPGATLLAFGGTRTYHRIAVAIEDAGWYIADSIHWVYGTGFPKSLDIGKAIDKRAGAEQEVVGPNLHSCAGRAPGIMHIGGQNARPQMEQRMVAEGNDKPPITAPATDLAREWDGWGTALKPSHEPIILARKPCEGSFAANAAKWGVAGLWIDGARVGTTVETWPATRSYAPGQIQPGGVGKTESTGTPPAGRWPPNTVFSHAPGCRCVGTEKVAGHKGYPNGPKGNGFHGGIGRMPDGSRDGAAVDGHADPDGTETVAKWECVEGCPVRLLGEQSGESVGSDRPRHNTADAHNRTNSMARTNHDWETAGHADRGTAARFFPQFDAEPFLYCAKASRAERERGLEGMDAQPPRPAGNGFGECTIFNGENGDEDWKAKNPSKPTRNPHPTVKPVALMRWLCRLTKTPSGGIVLDPFGGSGTTGVAAIQEGRDFVLIEQDPAYCDIARARIADAQKPVQPQLLTAADV